MIEDEDLYRAILDDPDGDMPRLVYADWLEEQGDTDRAEFIRIQCDLAGLPPSYPDRATLRARARLCDRSRRLEVQHRAEWLGPFGPAVEAGKVWAEFRRGFVGSILFPPGRDHPGLYQSPSVGTPQGDDWDRYRRARPTLLLNEMTGLFSRAPIQALTISASSPALPTLMMIPNLSRLRRLHLYFPVRGDVREFPYFDSDRLRLIASSRVWPDLRELVIPRGRFGAWLVGCLARSRHRYQLINLDLSHNPIGDEGAGYLAGATGLGGLEALTLFGCEIGDAGARALIESDAFPRLTMLDLYGNSMISGPMRQALRERFRAAVRL
jgi:uncharacterized protein (TIGR02996 family)